jgi:hypothetical protein
MGKYDSLFQDAPPPAAAPAPQASKYAALFADQPPEQSVLDEYVVQPFKDLGNSVLRANDFAARAITHPIDTLATNPGATLREGMRGVNSNIPGGNALVEAIGGPPAESPADAAAAPGAQAFGGVAGAAVTGKPIGGIVAKGVETAAPAIGKAIAAVGESAKARQIDRALEDLELKTYKRTRAGVRQDVVADVVAENPEVRAAASNDSKLAPVVEKLKQKAIDELDSHYAGYKVTLGDTIDNFNARIKALRAEGTSTDAAVADALEKTRDELTSRLGKRDSISVKQLRAEQTDFQGKGYGKAMPGDEAASARIEAAREASKAVGDAVVKRVTGMNYAEAKTAAASDPGGIAARLFKANDRVNAAQKIEASIADRTSRVQPREGLAGKLLDAGKKIRHSPTGYVLSLAPDAAAAGLTAADNVVARLASPVPAAAGQAVARAVPLAQPQIVGQLVQLARQGLRGPEFVSAATQAGVPPDQAQAFAGMLARSGVPLTRGQ